MRISMAAEGLCRWIGYWGKDLRAGERPTVFCREKIREIVDEIRSFKRA